MKESRRGKKTKTQPKSKSLLILITIICFGIFSSYLLLHYDSTTSAHINMQYAKTGLHDKSGTTVSKGKNINQKSFPHKKDNLTQDDISLNEETIFDALQKQHGKYIYIKPMNRSLLLKS